MKHQFNVLGSRKTAGLSLLLAAAGALSMSTQALAVAPISDNAEIFITGVVRLQSNDNIYFSHANAKHDEVYDFIPGLSYEWGKHAQMSGAAKVTYDIQNFKDHSELNTSLPTYSLTTNYDDGKTKMDFEGHYVSLDQPTRDVRGNGFLVKRNVWDLGMHAETEMTEKSNWGGGFTYTNTDYKSVGYVDARSTEVPINYYYKMDAKMDVSAGVIYRTSQVAGGATDSRDYFYNVGARGEFSPLLSGFLQVGWIQHTPDHGQNSSAVGVRSGFSYAITPKSTLTLSVSNDFGYSAYGSEYRALSGTVGIAVPLDEQFSFHGQMTYGRYTYLTTNQIDDYLAFVFGISYSVDTHISISAEYSNTRDNSNITVNSFQGNTFSLSASFRY